MRLCLEFNGSKRTAALLDDFKQLGFHYATKSGYSWGMHDLPKLEGKQALLDEGDKRIEEIEGQYEDGLLTNRERYTQVLMVCTGINDRITKQA